MKNCDGCYEPKDEATLKYTKVIRRTWGSLCPTCIEQIEKTNKIAQRVQRLNHKPKDRFSFGHKCCGCGCSMNEGPCCTMVRAWGRTTICPVDEPEAFALQIEYAEQVRCELNPNSEDV